MAAGHTHSDGSRGQSRQDAARAPPHRFTTGRRRRHRGTLIQARRATCIDWQRAADTLHCACAAAGTRERRRDSARESSPTTTEATHAKVERARRTRAGVINSSRAPRGGGRRARREPMATRAAAPARWRSLVAIIFGDAPRAPRRSSAFVCRRRHYALPRARFCLACGARFGRARGAGAPRT